MRSIKQFSRRTSDQTTLFRSKKQFMIMNVLFLRADKLGLFTKMHHVIDMRIAAHRISS